VSSRLVRYEAVPLVLQQAGGIWQWSGIYSVLPSHAESPPVIECREQAEERKEAAYALLAEPKKICRKEVVYDIVNGET